MKELASLSPTDLKVEIFLLGPSSLSVCFHSGSTGYTVNARSRRKRTVTSTESPFTEEEAEAGGG